jgi:surfeit locus 1 family protein
MKTLLAHRLQLSIGRYALQPKWLFILLTLLVLAIFLRLGFWQLERANEKDILEQSFMTGQNAAPITLDALPEDPAKLRYLSVTVTGEYDNQHSFLLDNKIHDHKVGYEVLTPMRIAGDRRLVLINRGWIPAPRQRAILPSLGNIAGEQRITGAIYISPKKPFTLEKDTAETNITWPYRIQVLDIPKIEAALGVSVYPFVLQLAPDQAHGFVRDWQPISMPSHKHLGYAVQWFTFALVLIIIFIALNVKKRY